MKMAGKAVMQCFPGFSGLQILQDMYAYMYLGGNG